MTIKELINKLKQFPPEAEVTYTYSCFTGEAELIVRKDSFSFHTKRIELDK